MDYTDDQLREAEQGMMETGEQWTLIENKSIHTNPVKVYIHNTARKIGSKWRTQQVAFYYHPSMDLQAFTDYNIELLEEELRRHHAESYIGSSDNIEESTERYIEERLQEQAQEALEHTIEAYNSDDWGYREPQGAEYYDMTLMGYAWNITEQKRYQTNKPVQKEAEDILWHNHYITNDLY